ncbi:programmed cell death protein 2 [Trametes meyenii]|nr:programmed cell death protein 2 [Trametes meyenii]
MPPADVDDDWSDSDDELNADVETNVDLGVPDGPVDELDTLLDPSVSRIGGHPTFLSFPQPPATHATCPNCSQPMELLIQIWCPLEESPNDRALYVWACTKGSCQRKEGSVRAWRELRYNHKYAEKLERKAARRKAKEAEEAVAAAAQAAKKAQPKSNPFALGAAPTASPFGLGSQIFGSSDAAAPSECPQTESAERSGSPTLESDDGGSDGVDSESSDGDAEGADALAASLQAASLDDSPWSAAPSYPPFYLSTVSEYLPPPPKTKVPAGATVDQDDDSPTNGKDAHGRWDLEGYENSLDVDHVFERFSERVSYEGEQCLRYERGGTPLPFASDKVFDRLFPVPPAPPLPVTKPDFMVAPPRKRSYAPASLPRCPYCDGPRVFECQLMPNLINVLRTPAAAADAKKLTDAERRAEVMHAFKGAAASKGMEWGTCMVFSCEKDCTGGKEGSTWREEYVLVQWDV